MKMNEALPLCFVILPSSVLAELALFSLHFQPASQPATQPTGIVYFLANLYLIPSKIDFILTLAYNGRGTKIFL